MAPPEKDANGRKRPAGRMAEHRGLIGVLFAVALVGLAIFLVNRMTYYAALGDCAFTHAPQCRQLLP